MPKAISMPRASTPSKKNYEINSFKGLDLSSAFPDVDPRRSPDAINMIADFNGNPVKRPGFELISDFGERINGRYKIGEHEVIHAGETFYLDGEAAYIGGADQRSSGQVVGEKLYIFDGECALMCDGYDIFPVSSEAYIPEVLAGKVADFCYKEEKFTGDGETKSFPLSDSGENSSIESITATVGEVSTTVTYTAGSAVFETAPADNAEIVITEKITQLPGGEPMEEFNLIGRCFTEGFRCDTGTEQTFTVTIPAYAKRLDKREVLVTVLDGNAEYVKKKEHVDFTVDRATGKVTFTEPVNKTPIIGEDNLWITVSAANNENNDLINRCRYSVCYGEGGLQNRVFITGNPDHPNRDFWSAAGDPTYFPDTYYSELGNVDTKILGYSIVDGYLGAHISPSYKGQSVVLRRSSKDELGSISFPVQGYLQGETAVAPYSMTFVEREPLFVTRRGIYALTSADLTQKTYTQNRSYYINKPFTEESELSEAYAAAWKQYYVCGINGKLYFLDTGQRSYERGEPYSTHQFECYLWTGIDARILWEEEGRLYFGDSTGHVCAFSEDTEGIGHYHDYSPEGDVNIPAYWTFPDFYGSNFWKNKTVRAVAIQAAPFANGKMELWVRREGIWEKLKDFTEQLIFFKFSSLKFSQFTFSGDETPKTLTAKIKIKKFDKIAFRVRCDDMDTAFGVYGFALEFTEGNRFKG